MISIFTKQLSNLCNIMTIPLLGLSKSLHDYILAMPGYMTIQEAAPLDFFRI